MTAQPVDSREAGGRNRRTIMRLLLAPGLAYLIAVAGILILTWPWALHFSGEFLNHWDPPFHAWKLELIARAILRGDPWLTATESTVLYPHAGTLFFEALQWPPAWLAALLLTCTHWPFELIYHLVLVAFWALSAPCMYVFLRSLRLSALAAFTGAVFFCIAPHRISYMVEFQMQLIYAIPLYYLFLVRLLTGQRLMDGAVLALVWWLQAVSELYQAVFLLVTTPFIVASFVSANPGLLRSRRLWRAGLVAGLVGAASLYPLLTPYFLQRSSGSVRRLMSEVTRHAAQPLSYLRPFNHLTPWTVDARCDEFSLYPTAAVLALACLGLVVWLRQALVRRTLGAHMRVVIAVLGVSLLAFLSVTLMLQNRIGLTEYKLLRLWDLLAVLSTIAGVALVLMPFEGSPRARLLRGLLGAAILCYFLSLGPCLSVGDYSAFVSKALASTTNSVYQSAYRYWLPMLSGFRVVSRFGVFVLFFLICTAATALDGLFRAWPGGPALRRLTAGGFLVLASLESIAYPILRSGFRPVDPAAKSPLIRRLERQRHPFVLAMVPMGDRMDEGMRMFTILRDRHLSVFAWGGFLPCYAYDVKEAVGRLNLETAFAQLSMLWPECLLLIDRSVQLSASEATRKRFPGCLLASESGETLDLVGVFSSMASIIDQDERFTLMKLSAAPRANMHRRIFRTDAGRAAPVIQATLVSDLPGRLSVTLNGKPLTTLVLPSGSSPFRHVLDPKRLVRSGFNELVFTMDGSQFLLQAFRLAPRDEPGDDEAGL